MPQARYEVPLTKDAEQDMESIYEYIVEFDTPANADAVLDRLLKVVESLAASRTAATPRS